jgi:hypothetical protein
VCIIAVPAAQESPDESETEPSLELIATPRSQIRMPRRRALVTLRVIIRNADEEYWCTGIQVVWGDGDSTSHESDCNPYEESTEDERKRKLRSYSHRYRTSGERRITVRLWRSGKIIASDHISIRIH